MRELVEQSLRKTELEPALIQEILKAGHLRKVSAGQIASEIDQEIPFVISGYLSLSRQAPNGDEFFLYYLERGDTCSMSITCCIEGKQDAIVLVAETDAILWLVPSTVIEPWIITYPSFRRFVFKSYQDRFDELLTAIDSVVFHNMEERIYGYLLDYKQATGSFEVRKTHQQIAAALNTSRVVVSRLLKSLEMKEKITLYRNKIEVM